jgi:hypothetical protein
MGSCAEVQHQLPEALPPSSPESPGGCGSDARGGQWAAYARRLRGSPTPSSSSRSSATTADTFLLEDVSGFISLSSLVIPSFGLENIGWVKSVRF